MTIDLRQMLDVKETIDQQAKANSVRWHGHALRKDRLLSEKGIRF